MQNGIVISRIVYKGWEYWARNAGRITAAEMKHVRKTKGYTWTDRYTGVWEQSAEQWRTGGGGGELLPSPKLKTDKFTASTGCTTRPCWTLSRDSDRIRLNNGVMCAFPILFPVTKVLNLMPLQSRGCNGVAPSKDKILNSQTIRVT
jgi:hypothetical protein